MTSPIASNGSPLSSIFDPWRSGMTKVPATGLSENGVDICNLYAALTYGTAAPVTGIESASADLNTIFAMIGTT